MMKRLLRLLAMMALLFALSGLVLAVVARITRGKQWWRGLSYRLFGRGPDPNVDDHTLADRVRSRLGPIEKQLDLPRVHVMVENHVVLLHGEVGWPHEKATLEEAVRAVPGVRGLESHLHVGMLKSDNRPSRGRLHAHAMD